MVRKSRQSSFGVNPDLRPERPEDRPGYRRNATTMSKLSRKGNTSARDKLRESNMSQFTGQLSSHGIHLHVRVTAHPTSQSGQRQPEVSQQSLSRSNHVQLSPGARNTATTTDKSPSARQYHGQVFENDTGMVTAAHAPYNNGRDSRRSQQRRPPQEALLPPIDGGVVGVSSQKPHGDLPLFDVQMRQPSFSTPIARSPVNRPPTDKHGRYLTRDKTVSTMDSMKLPDCSPVPSAIRRKRRKKTFVKDPKDRGLNTKISENSANMHDSLTDLTRKLQIGEDTVPQSEEQEFKQRPPESLEDERKRYASLASNAPQETFSVRKKIEQYKKWHESQGKENLQLLEQCDHEKLSEKENAKVADDSDTATDNSTAKREVSAARQPVNNHDSEMRLPSVHSKPEVNARVKSAKSWITWRTWRGVDESYAYNDVKQYIEENELMTQEKEYWIKKWVQNVDKEFFSHRSMDIDSSTSAGSSGGATV